MLYIYGKNDVGLMEDLRREGMPCCHVDSPKRPTKHSIEHHKVDGLAHDGWWRVSVLDDDGARIVAEG